MEFSKAANYHDFSGLAALRADAKANSDQAIAPVARQFEALFLQMMLKSMRDAVPEGGLFSSQGGELYREMHDKQLSLSLAEQGGIGLADTIARQLGGGQALTEQGAELRRELLSRAPQVKALAADTPVNREGD